MNKVMKCILIGALEWVAKTLFMAAVVFVIICGMFCCI